MLESIDSHSSAGGERSRRIWSPDQKRRIVAESFASGASVAEVARRYGLNANQLFTWRRRWRDRAASGASEVGASMNIVPVRVVTDAAPAAPAAVRALMGRMEIALVSGERIIVGADVDAIALSRILKVLR